MRTVLPAWLFHPRAADGCDRSAPRVPRLLVPAVCVAIVFAAPACGDDAQTTDTSVVAGGQPPVPTVPTQSTVPPTNSAAPTAPANTPLSDQSTSSSAVAETPPPTEPAAVVGQISLTVGVDSGPDRVETVPLGTEVTISITNPGADDEFHLHDYDLGGGQTVPAGVTASFTFVADRAGRFELESHETDAVLMVLEVV